MKIAVPDHILVKNVTQRLSSQGMRAPCRVNVSVQKGNVTLSGLIQFEHQRPNAIRSASNVDGVGRVLDQLKVIPKEAPPKNSAKNQY